MYQKYDLNLSLSCVKTKKKQGKETLCHVKKKHTQQKSSLSCARHKSKETLCNVLFVFADGKEPLYRVPSKMLTAKSWTHSKETFFSRSVLGATSLSAHSLFYLNS